MMTLNLQLFASKKGVGSSKNGRDGDDTLFAKIDGVVRFERKDKTRKQVSVYPQN